mmetsp:Transcript_36164/g.62083  ORF Transcript_36164/g.62083 Transcript_36164/m.62083 type:complete len:254 (+) Transcript_36164:419-1180(+)
MARRQSTKSAYSDSLTRMGGSLPKRLRSSVLAVGLSGTSERGALVGRFSSSSKGERQVLPAGVEEGASGGVRQRGSSVSTVSSGLGRFCPVTASVFAITADRSLFHPSAPSGGAGGSDHWGGGISWRKAARCTSSKSSGGESRRSGANGGGSSPIIPAWYAIAACDMERGGKHIDGCGTRSIDGSPCGAPCGGIVGFDVPCTPAPTSSPISTKQYVEGLLSTWRSRVMEDSSTDFSQLQCVLRACLRTPSVEA